MLIYLPVAENPSRITCSVAEKGSIARAFQVRRESIDQRVEAILTSGGTKVSRRAGFGYYRRRMDSELGRSDQKTILGNEVFLEGVSGVVLLDRLLRVYKAVECH